ncbi:hypothetical protein HHI36_016043 [Cryptolaemus montrouzieri]|uniref:Macoilin n=1 Tax=Cryptolaemus montrouzieri TaxID=559131 RepID=A0ABD2N7E1_9CUCU
MKRRNVEIGKMRRPIKKNKITEGIYGSTLLYLKFLSLWALVILADFILEFRFEFLWPFYLLLRSVYDSFKYQGLAFSVFFVCIALTSDMLCFFFIPVHWLFFAASTYVWVQYVWHTDKGICAPTIVLWVLFVYLETAVRLRDIKHMPGHLDLCRPFAAHCIGYPVVTLGFGFKSYIGFRMRQRKQRDVAKENEFYMQLIQQALPLEAVTQPSETAENAIVPVVPPVQNITKNSHSNRLSHHDKNGHISNGHVANGFHNNSHGKSHRKSVDKCKNDQIDHDQSKHSDKHDKHIDRQQKQQVNHSHSNGLAVSSGVEESCHHPVEVEQRAPPRKKEKREQDKEREAAEYLQRLETDVKRLRSDLHSSRNSEQELRLQVAALTTADKVSKGEISALQREVEELQQRLQNVQSSRTTEKQNLTNLERRLAEERRLRSNLESQLNQERKSRKQEEARAAQVRFFSTFLRSIHNID